MLIDQVQRIADHIGNSKGVKLNGTSLVMAYCSDDFSKTCAKLVDFQNVLFTEDKSECDTDC
jgi:hypothetical protein